MQKHNDAMKTSGHSALEKYTCHFICKSSKGLLKVLLCERWVGDWTELQHIDPPTLMAITAFLSRSPGLFNWGPGGPASLGHSPHSSSFTPTNSNFLWTELYYCFTSTQFNLSTVKVIPLIPSTGCTCYSHRCISCFDCSAGVNMQHYLYNNLRHGNQTKLWK